MPAEGVSTFQERLQTFKDAHPVKRRGSTTKKRAPASLKWPHKAPSGHDLAQAGFYFHPSSSSPDNVRCFTCEVNLDGWEAEDEPILEHYAHRSDCAWAVCRYAKHKFEQKEAIEEDPMSDVYASARKATFEGWPHQSKRGWKCKIDKMVEAGWHYDPSQDMEDGVTCSYCSTELGGWERKDDPFEEHLKRGTECPFFALCDRFASSRPSKPKRARTSKASRASTQSTISATNYQHSLLDLDEDLAAIEASGDDTVISNASKPTKSAKGRKKTASRTTKSKAAQSNDKDESAIDVQGEADLGLSTMSQPAKKSRSKKKSAADETVVDASDLGASTTQPARKTSRKKKATEILEIIEPEIVSQTSTAKPARQTRRKVSKQMDEANEAQALEQDGVSPLEEDSTMAELVQETAPPSERPAPMKKLKEAASEEVPQSEPTATKAPARKGGKTSKGVKRTSDGKIKCQAPQIRMSALDKLDSSVMVLDEVPHIFEDSPDESTKPAKRQSSTRQPLQELEPAAVQRVSEASMLRSSNMHEAESSTPRMTPEPASDKESPEPPTPTPARQSFSVVKRASMMRAGMRPSSTPLPSKKERQSHTAAIASGNSSPQSSDAENKPPSARPEIKNLQLKSVSPLRNEMSKTPMLSPSKRSNVVSRVQTDCRWTPADLDLVFEPYSPVKGSATQTRDKENFVPGDAALDVNHLDADGLQSMVKAVRSAVTEEQRRMTVEQWLKHTGLLASEKLRAECETMVTLFEREGAKAMRVLEAIRVSR